jgi:hypothetical protein
MVRASAEKTAKKSSAAAKKATKTSRVSTQKATKNLHRGGAVKPPVSRLIIAGEPVYLQSIQNGVVRFLGVDDRMVAFMQLESGKPSIIELFDSKPEFGDNRSGDFPRPVVRAMRPPPGHKFFLVNVQVWNNPNNRPPNPWAVRYEIGEMIQGSFVPIIAPAYRSPDNTNDTRWVLHVVHSVQVVNAR